MVILTMLPRYTQGTICSTMSLCDVMGPIQGVVVTGKEFQSQEQTSGTTATFVIIHGWAITITSVGDSLYIFDAQGGDVSLLTTDHKLEENVEEIISTADLHMLWFHYMEVETISLYEASRFLLGLLEMDGAESNMRTKV